MSIPEQVHDEVRRLLWTVREGDLKPDEAARLQALLAGDSEVRELYVVYSYLCGSLEWDHSARRNEVSDQGSGVGVQGSGVTGQGAGAGVHPLSFILNPSLSSGVLVSYLIVALIVGAAVLAARAWNVRGEHGIVAAAGPGRPAVRGDAPAKPGGVGQVATIASAVGCRWAGPAAPAFAGEQVMVGREYAITSGRLEIAYGTGTTIVLEGPAAYRVDSPQGGFLSRGKLLARTQRCPGSDGQAPADVATRGPASSVSESVSLSHLTIIRTPTVVVSTVSAELSVTAADLGAGTVRVSRGTVALQLASSRPDTEAPVYLAADSSALVEAAGVYRGITVKGPATRSAVFAHRAISAETLMTLVSADTKLQGDGAAGLQLVHFDLDAGERAAGPLPGPFDPQTQKAYSAPIVWQGRHGVTYRQRFQPTKRGASARQPFVWAAYVAHGRMIAIRLNGKNLPIPRNDDDEVVQFGRILIEQGFRAGTNEIEFQVVGNVASAADSPLLKRRISIFMSGFRPIH